MPKIAWEGMPARLLHPWTLSEELLAVENMKLIGKQELVLDFQIENERNTVKKSN